MFLQANTTSCQTTRTENFPEVKFPDLPKLAYRSNLRDEMSASEKKKSRDTIKSTVEETEISPAHQRPTTDVECLWGHIGVGPLLINLSNLPLH